MSGHIFISHANSRYDNEFALWLSLRLTREGYKVWCDLTMLLGGEYHWVEIEKAISQSSKFIYILSNESNTSDPDNGEFAELSRARELGRDPNRTDFVMPALIERLSSSLSSKLRGVNIIDFERRGWANGLANILEKLEIDEIPRDSQAGPSSVTTWWINVNSAERGVIREKESYLSNLFPIYALPDQVYYHSFSKYEICDLEAAGMKYQSFIDGTRLVSFARLDDLTTPQQLMFDRADRTKRFDTGRFLHEGDIRAGIERRDARAAVVRLLNVAWDRIMQMKPLGRYEMAGRNTCHFFPRGFADRDRVTFEGVNGPSWRQLSGIDHGRNWHFGISGYATFYPLPCFVVKPHVLFSDDGYTIWESDSRLHRARRRVCKFWWNDEWRDRILAAMSWIGDGAEYIDLPLGNDTEGNAVVLQVRIRPVAFDSPISYLDPGAEATVIDEDDEEDPEDDFESTITESIPTSE